MLTFSYTTPESVLLTVELPSPKFGDNHVFENRVVVKETLMGSPLVVANTNLDVLQTLQFSIDEVSITLLADWMAFYDIVVGLEIFLVTHLGHVWEGWIIEEPVYTESNRGSWSFQLTFTGQRVS